MIDIMLKAGKIDYRYWIEGRYVMARGKFQTLTEQMFYILLCLRQEQ